MENLQYFLDLVDKACDQYEDGFQGVDECLRLYCEENNIPEETAWLASHVYMNEKLRENNIPTGKHNLSKEYIYWKANKEYKSE